MKKLKRTVSFGKESTFGKIFIELESACVTDFNLNWINQHVDRGKNFKLTIIPHLPLHRYSVTHF